MICEICNNSNVIKAGFVYREQRYKCKDCDFHFIKKYKRLSENERLRAVRFCSYGLSMNVVAQMFFITTTTVARWVKQYKEHPNDIKLTSDDLDCLSVKAWTRRRNSSSKRNDVLKFQVTQVEKIMKNYENVKVKKIS